MDILNSVSLESNSQIKINFDHKFWRCWSLLQYKTSLKTNDTALYRLRKDDKDMLQAIHQTTSAYFEDDCADELTNEPCHGRRSRKEYPGFPAYHVAVFQPDESGFPGAAEPDHPGTS